MTKNLMTLTAYANSIGVDKSTISKQVKAGQIPVEYLPGKKRPMIDQVAADEARARNIDSAKSQNRHFQNAQPRVTPAALVESRDALPEATPAGVETGGPAARADESDYTRERTRSVSLDAQRKEIELLELTGTLVPKSQVEEAARSAGRILRDQLLSAADDLAEAVFNAGNINSARTELRKGLRKALGDIADELQTQSEQVEAAAVQQSC